MWYCVAAGTLAAVENVHGLGKVLIDDCLTPSGFLTLEAQEIFLETFASDLSFACSLPRTLSFSNSSSFLLTYEVLKSFLKFIPCSRLIEACQPGTGLCDGRSSRVAFQGLW